MREVYDYSGHPLLGEIEEAVSQIVVLLDRHGYSDQSLYVAQECLIDELIQLEAAAREHKAKARLLRGRAAEAAIKAKDDQGGIPDAVKQETKDLYQEADAYDEARHVLQYGRWLLRYIGDGIAWHAFSHNRRFIRALASKQPVPAIADPAGIDRIRRLFRAFRRLGREWLPVLHDLTNCLRTADLSVFRDGMLYRIMELKIHQGETPADSDVSTLYPRDDRAQRQEERLSRILRFMETKDLGDLHPELAGGKAIDSGVPERHNFDTVSRAMAKARDHGYGFDSPELGVMYLAWDLAATTVDVALAEAQVHHPDILAPVITFRSISARYKGHHQGLPITAMAISAEDILDILFGRLGVIAIVNFALLEKFCADHGVPVKVHTRNGEAYSVRVEADDFAGEVQEGLWDRVMLEALSLDSFAGLLRSIFDEHLSGTFETSA